MEMLHIWQSVPESKYTFVVSLSRSLVLSFFRFFGLLVLFPRFFYKPKGRLFKRSVSYTLFTAYKIDDYCSSVGS